MSKTKEQFLKDYNKLEAELTGFKTKIGLITNDAKSKMTKETYRHKIHALEKEYRKTLRGRGIPTNSTHDLNDLVNLYNNQLQQMEGIMGSRYTLGNTGKWIDAFLKSPPGTNPIPGLTQRPHYSNEYKPGYTPNDLYIDRFNPKGETAFQQNLESKATDKWNRDYDHPHFGINPNRLILSTNGDNTKVDKSTLTISNGQ